MAKSVSYSQWALESYCIGQKLRALRTQKRLTLARLAGETGLSTALLSKLETDRMIPTLPTLATISRVYGVGLSHFFKEPGRHSLSITRKAHLEGVERGMEQLKIIPLNAVEANPALAAAHASLAAAHRASGAEEPAERSLQVLQAGKRTPLVAQMIEFPAAGMASSSESLHHTSGVMYVLEGKLQLDSGGLHELLEPGDCAYVDSDMPLAWSAAGKQRCRVLAVFPGEAVA
jgi:transcriptional regulator with XRE-family HTH domain